MGWYALLIFPYFKFYFLFYMIWSEFVTFNILRPEEVNVNLTIIVLLIQIKRSISFHLQYHVFMDGWRQQCYVNSVDNVMSAILIDDASTM